MLEVTKEGFELEGQRREGDEVVGSWTRVRVGSSLMGLVARSIRPSNTNGFVTELWVRDVDVISSERVGCDPSSARSQSEGDFPSNGVSLVYISIRELFERFGLFSAGDTSSEDRQIWE